MRLSPTNRELVMFDGSIRGGGGMGFARVKARLTSPASSVETISHTQPMPYSRTRRRHSAAVSRRIPSALAIALSDCPCAAPRIICARSTTCCGVDPARIHCSSRISSASDNTTGKLVFDIQPSYGPNAYADSIAGHYTSLRGGSRR